MGELHTGPRHSLSDADPESYFDLLVIPPLYQPKGEGDCSITRLTPSGWCLLALVNCQLGEGNSDNEPTGRRGSLALVGNSPKRGKV